MPLPEGAKAAAVEVARQHLIKQPVLVPVRGHRYLPAAPEPTRAPVLSVYQTDIIYYGADLADYCAYEFLGQTTGATPAASPSGPTSSREPAPSSSGDFRWPADARGHRSHQLLCRP